MHRANPPRTDRNWQVVASWRVFPRTCRERVRTRCEPVRARSRAGCRNLPSGSMGSILSAHSGGKPITRSGGKPITRSDANRSPVPAQTDHLFRRKPITCSGANRSPVPPTQTDHLSERSDAGRNHESRFSVRVDGRLRFRIESPFRSSLYALCTRRSRIALASVGSPMTSCHLRLPPISRTG